MTAALAALLTASAVAAAPAQAGPSLSQPLNGTGFGRACVYPAPGTSITPDKSTQVLVAKATSTSRGTWARYQWEGCGWKNVATSSWASFGKNGLRDGAKRSDGDGTTPRGVYPMKETFGQAASLGSNCPTTGSIRARSGRGRTWITTGTATSVGSTAGCIGLNSRAEIERMISWMDPKQRPTIVIS